MSKPREGHRFWLSATRPSYSSAWVARILGSLRAPCAELDQRVGLLRAGGDDAAGPVILEAAPHQMHAVGEQGGGEGVAGMALVALAVEGEADGLGAVDAAALEQAEGLLAHGWGSPIL